MDGLLSAEREHAGQRRRSKVRLLHKYYLRSTVVSLVSNTQDQATSATRDSKALYGSVMGGLYHCSECHVGLHSLHV